MKKCRDLKIVTKLMISFGFLAILAGIIGWVGLSSSSRIGDAAASMYKDQLVPVTSLGEANAALLQARMAVWQAMMQSDAEARQQFIARSDQSLRQLEQSVDAYGKSALTQKASETLQLYRATYKEYLEKRAAVIRLVLQKKDTEAAAALNSTVAEAAKELHGSLNSLIEVSRNIAQDANRTNASTYSTARLTIWAFILFGMAAALGMGAVLSRLIGGPVKEIEAAAVKLAQGDMNVQVETRSADELGALANSFRSLVAALKEVSSAADEIARGNLTVKLRVRSENDQMMRALDGMITGLSSLVTSIRSVANEVSAGSSALSGAITELSQGSSEQAASAEEASASMEQMVSNIRQNADNAQQTGKGWPTSMPRPTRERAGRPWRRR